LGGLEKGGLNCEIEYYLKTRAWGISRLENNGGQFLLRRSLPEYTTLKTFDAMNYYVSIQQDKACKKQ